MKRTRVCANMSALCAQWKRLQQREEDTHMSKLFFMYKIHARQFWPSRHARNLRRRVFVVVVVVVVASTFRIYKTNTGGKTGKHTFLSCVHGGRHSHTMQIRLRSIRRGTLIEIKHRAYPPTADDTHTPDNRAQSFVMRTQYTFCSNTPARFRRGPSGVRQIRELCAGAFSQNAFNGKH